MGVITGLWQLLFGEGRNVVVETAEAFRENTEKSAIRAADARAESLAQFAMEFGLPRQGLFDRVIDGVNRLPRPALALGTIYLFVIAMYDPERFAAGMAGLALVPDPLWWLMGAIVSFYFGARYQAKAQDFQRTMATGLLAQQKSAATAADQNPALSEWRQSDD